MCEMDGERSRWKRWELGEKERSREGGRRGERVDGEIQGREGFLATPKLPKSQLIVSGERERRGTGERE